MFTLSDPVHGVVDAERAVGKHKLILRARQIKKTHAGWVECLLALLVDGVAVQSDTVTVDKDSDRHNFANAIYGTPGARGKAGKLGGDIVAAFPQPDFEQELMLWSRALYPRFIGATAGAYELADAEPSAPRWAVPGLILDGQTSIWAGDRGANKSTLMRLVCQSLEHGHSALFNVYDKQPCIWVNAEEDRDEHHRQMGNVNQALGLTDRTARTFVIHARGMSISDLTIRLERAVMETGAKHIFVDSLSRMAQGMNLNENATATLLIDSLAGLGPSVNWIGHTGHEYTNRLSGSKHFENAARLMVLLQSRISFGGVSPELTRGVRTRVYKANGAAPTEPQHFTFEYHRNFGLLRAERADASEWPVLLCNAMTGEVKQAQCGRKTWDGVSPSGAIRCPRHRGEDDEG